MPGPDPENENSAVKAYFQIGPRDVAGGALLGLLAHLVREPCFDQLRTKEQLGYMVFSGMSDEDGVLGLWLMVQSSTKGPAYLDDRIEAFLAQFRQEVLGSMDAEKFTANVEACILTRTKKDKRLYEQAGRFWTEIESQKLVFNREFAEAEVLRTITLEQVVALFDEKVARGGAQRRKLSCQVIGKGHDAEDAARSAAQVEAGATLIGASQESMDRFKAAQALYPAPQAGL